VYYLEPQQAHAGETGIEFSNRVKKLIADTAGLEDVDFDGYMKYFRPSQRYVEKRQKIFADSLMKRLANNKKNLTPSSSFNSLTSLSLSSHSTAARSPAPQSASAAEGMSPSDSAAAVRRRNDMRVVADRAQQQPGASEHRNGAEASDSKND